MHDSIINQWYHETNNKLKKDPNRTERTMTRSSSAKQKIEKASAIFSKRSLRFDGSKKQDKLSLKEDLLINITNVALL